MGISAALAALNGDYTFKTAEREETQGMQEDRAVKDTVAKAASADTIPTDIVPAAGGTPQIFENSEFGKLEVLMIDGDPYFPATECASMLGYTNPQKAIRDHCKGVNKMRTPSAGGNQTKNYISESDLYRLVMRSNLPSAERFADWVTDDVLPSIRKHGAYMAPAVLEKTMTDVDYLYQLAVTLKDEHDKRIAAEATMGRQAAYIEEVKPQVEVVHHLETTTGTISMNQFAKILSKNNVRIGRNALFGWMRMHGYLQRDNMPYQKAAPYFNYGHTLVNSRWVPYTRVTGKGVLFFTRKIMTEKGYAKEYRKVVLDRVEQDFSVEVLQHDDDAQPVEAGA